MIRPRSGIAKLFEKSQAETGIPARRRSFHGLSPSIIPSHLGNTHGPADQVPFRHVQDRGGSWEGGLGSNSKSCL